ncbi:MAG: hypothetical protein II688_01795 [Lachnospiraceae bacterium]|nr:hypothetical protein [Lachnospiraceae bacterium]
MANWETRFTKIMYEIASEENITITTFDDWAYCFEKEGKRAFVYGYQFGLDNGAVSGILKDKAAAYELMNKAGIKAVPHYCIMNPKFPEFSSLESSWEIMLAYLEKYGQVVLKDNLGTGGRDVYLVKTKAELEKAAHIIFERASSAAVSPYVDIINEYRAVMLDGQIRLLFAKQRVDSWKHNLGQGSIPIIMDENSAPCMIKDLARKAVDLFGLRFASVDIIETKEGCMILEINGGVMMENIAGTNGDLYEKAKGIYRDAILKML